MSSSPHSAEKLGSYTGARPDVVDMALAPVTKVLDIGCSDGTLSSAFAARGAETWGIEIDDGFAQLARKKLDHVMVGDALEQVGLLRERGETFDTVICADSLEHMVDPGAVLGVVRQLVAHDGQCILSLPNVRFYTTFTNLIFRGKWPYLDRGVHDRTHLRWFTDRNAREMIKESKFKVDDVLVHYRLSDLPTRRINRIARRLAFGPWAPFLAYQYVYRLTPA